MAATSPSTGQSPPLLAPAAWGVVALVALPLLGLGLSALQPPGLVEPPPLSLERLLPLLKCTAPSAEAHSTLTSSSENTRCQ